MISNLWPHYPSTEGFPHSQSRWSLHSHSKQFTPKQACALDCHEALLWVLGTRWCSQAGCGPVQYASQGTSFRVVLCPPSALASKISLPKLPSLEMEVTLSGQDLFSRSKLNSKTERPTSIYLSSWFSQKSQPWLQTAVSLKYLFACLTSQSRELFSEAAVSTCFRANLFPGSPQSTSGVFFRNTSAFL